MPRRDLDHELFAGILPIKDSTIDDALLEGSTVSGDGEEGFHAVRFGEIGETLIGGERPYKRDKEYDFRPKIAKFVHDAINYRDFREPPTPSPAGGATTISIGSGAGSGLGGGSGQPIDSWLAQSEEVGIELSLVSDTKNYLKSKPTFNPSHMNSRNRSTLIISKEELTTADKDRDLPRRYFGRVHDMFIPRQTQDVELKRVVFPGSGFWKKNGVTKKYRDGFWKAMWNVTPLDQPFEFEIEQINEEGGGPGKHGFGPHGYSSAISASLSPVTPYFQGGWMVDMVLDRASMIHDVIGVGFGSPYDRYIGRDGKIVSTTYVRHDAIHAKAPAILGRIHFREIEMAEELPEGRKFWTDLWLDTDQAGVDTQMAPHETGQWRVLLKMPRPGVPTDGRVPVPDDANIPVGEDPPSIPKTGEINDVPTMDFKPGKTSGYCTSGCIPEGILITEVGTVRLKYTIPTVAGIADTVTMHMGYKFMKCDAGESTDDPYTYVTKTLLGRHPEPPFASDFPAPGEVGCVDFDIPEGFESGESLHVIILRSKTDVYADDFKLIEEEVTIGTES